jgi:general secretion pathway protein I
MVTDMHRRHASGFTLIEAVVALLIVALGMTAVFIQLNQFASNSIYLRDKTLASWIGSNIVAEYSLNTEPIVTGEKEEEREFASREWHLRIEVAETQVENLHQVNVDISLADQPDLVIHTVSGLIEPPIPAGFPPVSWEDVSGPVGGRGGRGGRGGEPGDFGVSASGQ